MYFKQIFDDKLAQYTYLIGCQSEGKAIVVDPMRDIDQYYPVAEKEGLSITAAVDTHIHADFLSGLREFAESGIRVLASDEGDKDWKYEWLKNSSYVYELLKDGSEFSIGNVRFRAVHTPGHTPEHLSFLVSDGEVTSDPMGLLSGDFIFVGDVGRPDLLETAAGVKGQMKSSAKTLYRSIQKFQNQPEYLQVWPGHGSGSACGKAMSAVPESTVGYERRFNPSLQAADTEDHFVEFILDGQPEPPLYFARMKRENRDGPEVLGSLPKPRKRTIGDIMYESGKEGVILDTREAEEFMNGHLADSLLSPLNKNFNTVAGCYVEKNSNIYLITEASRVEEAVRDLVRVGLDRIQGYATPEDLVAFSRAGGLLDTLSVIDFEDVKIRLREGGYQVLDVRKADEFEGGHLPGAINITHTRLPEHLDELSKEKPLLVHCKLGIRSSVASALLKRNGFTVEFVNDDITNWESEGQFSRTAKENNIKNQDS